MLLNFSMRKKKNLNNLTTALDAVSNLLLKKHYNLNWTEMSFISVFSVCLLSRDTRNARIKWYGLKLTSRHCAFKIVMK